MHRATLLLSALLLTGCGAAQTSQVSSRPEPHCPPKTPRLVNRDLPTKGFVRPGAQRVLICRYSGLNAKPAVRLVGSRVAGKTLATTLARSLNALEPVTGIYHCPMEDGSEILVIFRYANHPAERVALELTGCRFVTNGRSSRFPTPRLWRRLHALTKS